MYILERIRLLGGSRGVSRKQQPLRGCGLLYFGIYASGLREKLEIFEFLGFFQILYHHVDFLIQ